jgi:hypothetical protein
MAFNALAKMATTKNKSILAENSGTSIQKKTTTTTVFFITL